MIPFRSHMPIVNIITINRNNKAGLQRTIESVLMQKYRMINHIIIDGNSSDGSAEYLKELCSKVFYISEQDDGIYHAMTKGLSFCKEGLIIWLNSGDVLIDPTDIEKVVDSKMTQNWFLAYGDIEYFNYESQKTISIIKQYPYRHLLLAFGIRWIPHPATIFDYKLAQDLKGFRLDLGSIGDQDFIFRASKIHRPIYLSFFRVRMETGGVSSLQSKRDRNQNWRLMRKINGDLLFNSFKIDTQLQPLIDFFDKIHIIWMRCLGKSKFFKE